MLPKATRIATRFESGLNSLMKAESVKNIVSKIVEESGTYDVFEISKRNGVTIRYESWHPVTIGEFERKTNTINVNIRTLKEDNDKKLEKTIIAHELGHFFAREFNFDKNEEEHFAHQFAQELASLSE